jgi:hypothetical protein
MLTCLGRIVYKRGFQTPVLYQLLKWWSYCLHFLCLVSLLTCFSRSETFYYLLIFLFVLLSIMLVLEKSQEMLDEYCLIRTEDMV